MSDTGTVNYFGYHAPYNQILPPNIAPISQLPASMPPYIQPYPYFNPPPMLQPGFFPPSALSGQQFPTVHPIMPPISFAHSTAPPPAVLSQPTDHPSLVVDTSDPPSYQWLDGNVKLECTVGKEPLGWEDEGWKWRSSGVRRTGIPQGAFKVDKRGCLGVFHCSCKGPDGLPCRFFRPKTATNARNK